MIFVNWNPWSKTEFNSNTKINSIKNKLVRIDPIIDVFSYKLQSSWRDTLYNIIEENPMNIYFIPTVYPGNATNKFIKNKNIWIGLKLTKNNHLALIKYDEMIEKERRWVYLKNYKNDMNFFEELFKCTGPEHTLNGFFWQYVYPCSTCNGTGIFNKYNLKWLVLSGHKSGISRDNVDEYRINCENTGIPFYYEKAWIGKKLIREPNLYGEPCIEYPKNLIAFK
jgi:hypothetical protein